jgi:ABC-type Mn2+/Zn2+ transport system ATPase subunit
VLLNGELIAAGPTAQAFTEDNIQRAYTTRVFAGVDQGHAV